VWSHADRRVKLLIQFAVEGSHSGAYSHPEFNKLMRALLPGGVVTVVAHFGAARRWRGAVPPGWPVFSGRRRQ